MIEKRFIEGFGTIIVFLSHCSRDLVIILRVYSRNEMNNARSFLNHCAGRHFSIAGGGNMQNKEFF